MTDQERRDHIAALIREREACQQAGLADRVTAIDIQLRLLGATGAPPLKRATRR